MNNRIDSSTVFAVSGGARGVTARCVIELARRYRCRFILLGRTALEGAEPGWAQGCPDEASLKKALLAEKKAAGEKLTPVQVNRQVQAVLFRREVGATLAAIAEAGGQAEYLSADISNDPDLAGKLAGPAGRLGPISGLIHGAGQLADKFIENKTLADFESVYSAKVRGLVNLLNALPPGQLRYLALFSSVAGFYGNSGQADYALSNEILNKIAHLLRQQQPDCRVVALDWGPWDGGMVTPELKKAFEKRNIAVIPVDEGPRMLAEELEHSDAAQVILGSPIPRPARRPEGELKTYRLRRRIDPAANPFLRDHVIGGNPVLPLLCVIGWIANACEQLYPGFSLYRSDENRVLKGIVFDGTQPEEFLLELQEVAKDEEQVEFEATISSLNAQGRIQYHYKTHPVLRQTAPEAPLFPVPAATTGPVKTGEELYTDGTLFHGPAFQGVRRLIEANPQRVVMECYLPAVPEKDQGQFPVQSFNPYAVDVQLQGMLIWARQVYQAGSLPLRIQRVEQFRPLPFDRPYYAVLEVRSSSETGLVADVTACDPHGLVYNRVAGAEVTISQRLNRLFEPAGSSLARQ